MRGNNGCIFKKVVVKVTALFAVIGAITGVIGLVAGKAESFKESRYYTNYF